MVFARASVCGSGKQARMRLLDSGWTMAAAITVALSAAAGLALGGNFEAMLIALVGGFAAILLTQHPFADASARSGQSAFARIAEARAEASAQLLDALDEPALLLREGKVLLANPPATRLLGAHIVGENFRTAIRHPAAADYLARNTDDDPRGIELAGLGGRDQHWLLRKRRLDDGRILVQLSDSSAARAAERMRVDFVANASHELRTPLAAILGYVETLSDPAAGGDATTRTRFLDVMMREARRMQGLVDDLISLSRIEGDKHRVPDDAVDLPTLIAEADRVARQSPGGEGRDIRVSIASNVPPVAGDRAQLSQLLHNLVGNAIKYGRAGTPVIITVEPVDAAMIRLSIADAGDGIAPEHLPRLTERFYRIDSGRSRAMGGTGLGLSIVKHIVERHRGKLEIASKLGVGTTVSVTLPVVQKPLSSN